MKIRVWFLFLISSISLQGQVLSPFSPDKRFELKLGPEEIGDNAVKFTSFIIDAKESDTLHLGINVRHDFPPPNWFWDKKSAYVIFETSNYGVNSSIQVWDLNLKKVSHTLVGGIPLSRTVAGQFWDSKEEILFFYDLGDGKQQLPKLKSLNLQTKQVQTLHEYSSPFDIEIPLININHKEHSIHLAGKKITY